MTPSTWDSIRDWTLADVGRLTILKLKEFYISTKVQNLESLERNQLKRSLMRCSRYKTNGRLMAIRFLALTCFSAMIGTEAFCQPCCMSTVVFESKVGGYEGKPFSNAWDADSGKIGVDCRASACMSDRIQDFLPGSLKPCNTRVQTFGGHHVSNRSP